MKKLIIAIAFLISQYGIIHSQVALDIFGGLHSYDLPVTDADIGAGIESATFGIHAGAKLKFNFDGLFIESGLIVNNVSAKYIVDNPVTPEQESRSLNFDIPVVAGIDLGPLSVFAGPVAHIRFSNYDDLLEVGSYDDNVSSMFFGAHGGVALSFGKFGVELRYEKNFVGDDLGTEEIGNQLKLIDSNSRIMASVFIRFSSDSE